MLIQISITKMEQEIPGDRIASRSQSLKASEKDLISLKGSKILCMNSIKGNKPISETNIQTKLFTRHYTLLQILYSKWSLKLSKWAKLLDYRGLIFLKCMIFHLKKYSSFLCKKLDSNWLILKDKHTVLAMNNKNSIKIQLRSTTNCTRRTAMLRINFTGRIIHWENSFAKNKMLWQF